MANDRDDAAENSPKGRRSSFVAPTEDNSDYVPSLPPVGSSPIPAASDVNYFPSVQTGTPQLNQPAPPPRLVVPSRQSLTEEQIAARFAESVEMTSTEQIAFLDAQMTLREADVKTAKDFSAQLALANPVEASALLGELKAKFGDLDDSIAEMSIGAVPAAVVSPTVTDAAGPTTSVPDEVSLSDQVEAAISPVMAPSPVPPVEREEPAPPPASANVDLTTTQVVDPDTAMLGRYRGWSVIVTIAVTISALIPGGFAVFTAFGAPLPELVKDFLGLSGVVALLTAIAVSLPIALMARSTAFRHGTGWRVAFGRVFGGGAWPLAILAIASIVTAITVILLVPAQGIGQQIAAIDVVAQALSAVAPNAHIGVVLVASVLLLAAITAALPRRVFRAKVLALTGFTIAGPSVVLLQGIAIAANTEAGPPFSLNGVLVATALVPLILVLVSAGESGIATVTSHDERKLHGMWLYIGLALGAGFAALTLVQGFASADAVDVYVGSNPVLHASATNAVVAVALATVIVGVPLLLVLALAIRHVAMVANSSDRANPAVWIRIVTVVVPLALLASDVLGLLPDLATVLPQLPFAAIPVVVLTGTLAGASVAANRVLSRGARATLTSTSLLLIVVGFAATTWALPWTDVYLSVIAPLVASVGISGSAVLIVPSALLVVSFLISLIVSAAGSRPAVDRD